MEGSPVPMAELEGVGHRRVGAGHLNGERAFDFIPRRSRLNQG
jgi:hypothetical protein